MYLVKTPFFIRWLYPTLCWRIPEKEKIIYLSFDDGPHPIATPFVLDLLQQYNAKASFFCIGKNVLAEPEIYNRILAEGHCVGNHTQHHTNGWKTSTDKYLKDIEMAAQCIKSNLFRPPYGRIKRSQIAAVKAVLNHQNQSTVLSPAKIIMWDVLSGDFDQSLSPKKCAEQVIKYTNNGSIVVFHDSAKAYDRLAYALPKVLDYFTDLGYQFKALPQ